MTTVRKPPVLPGSVLGILGSGQLGRMLAMVARRMGYGVKVYSPDKGTPAGQVADVEICAPYDDIEALKRFAESVDVVTLEFENIPVDALKVVEAITPVYPQPHVLYVTQNRLREKTFLSELGLPVAPFHTIFSWEDLEEGLHRLGFPAVLKTAGFGYDGKGQAKINDLQEAKVAYKALNGQLCILEAFIELEREISVIAARTDGLEEKSPQFKAARPVENRHRNHILDVTLAPAEISSGLEAQAINITRAIMEAFDMRGLLCVEFFIARNNRLLVNELAPRPHNSGHYSLEAAVCDQFEQQLRAVCGLPLGDPGLRQPAAMINLLGDVWEGREPDWLACLEYKPVYLHLYGKTEPRSGRKMGHLTALAETPQEALALARQAEDALKRSPQSLQSLYKHIKK